MENSVRIERIKSTLSYDAAFDHLTNFYKRRKISHDQGADTVMDLTGDDDDSAEAQDHTRKGQDNDEDDDGEDRLVQTASGVPCMRLHKPKCNGPDIQPTKRSWPWWIFQNRSSRLSLRL